MILDIIEKRPGGEPGPKIVLVKLFVSASIVENGGASGTGSRTWYGDGVKKRMA